MPLHRVASELLVGRDFLCKDECTYLIDCGGKIIDMCNCCRHRAFSSQLFTIIPRERPLSSRP